MAVREKAETTKPAEGHVAALESNLSKKSSDTSPFLGELSQITGPAGVKGAVDKLDKDGFTGRAEAMEAQKILGDTHGFKNAFGGGSITPDDIKKYGEKPGLSDGEKAYVKKLGEDFKKISGDEGKTINQKDIYAYQAQQQQHADLTNFNAKDPKSGKSLADGLKNPDGGINGKALEDKLKDPKLTDKDRASLEAVNNLRETSWGSPTGDVTPGKMLDANKAAKLSDKEIAGVPKTGEPKSADQQESAAALKDLTAKPGGGQSLLDKIGDGKGGVDYAKTQDLIAHPEQHNLTPENIKTLNTLNSQFDAKEMPSGSLSKEDLQKMGAQSGVDYDKLAAKPATPAESADQKGREKEFAHLFEKGADGKSMYDRLKDKDGGISSSKLDEETKRVGGSKDDRDTAAYLKTLAKDGVFSKKDLTKEDIVSKAHEHNMKDETLKKAGVAAEKTDKPAAAPAAGGDIKPEGHKALVVHSGQGYYHVAERLLSEAHKGDKKYEPSQHELKELVSQLRHANDNRKSLNSKEELKIDDAIKHNPALAGLFAASSN